MTNYKIYLFVILASIIVIGMVAIAARYLGEIGAARETLDSLNSEVSETDCGTDRVRPGGGRLPGAGYSRRDGRFRPGIDDRGWESRSRHTRSSPFRVLGICARPGLKMPL